MNTAKVLMRLSMEIYQMLAHKDGRVGVGVRVTEQPSGDYHETKMREDAVFPRVELFIDRDAVRNLEDVIAVSPFVNTAKRLVLEAITNTMPVRPYAAKKSGRRITLEETTCDASSLTSTESPARKAPRKRS